jgi:hypothetical protein
MNDSVTHSFLNEVQGFPIAVHLFLDSDLCDNPVAVEKVSVYDALFAPETWEPCLTASPIVTTGVNCRFVVYAVEQLVQSKNKRADAHCRLR